MGLTTDSQIAAKKIKTPANLNDLFLRNYMEFFITLNPTLCEPISKNYKSLITIRLSFITFLNLCRSFD